VSEAVTLRALGGAAAAPRLLADLALVGALPPNARRTLWRALAPALPDPVPAAGDAAIDGFATEHGLDEATLARALKACRHLVREAASRDLDVAAFAADLAVLDGAGGELRAILLPGYEDAKVHVREELVTRAIAAHGRVLVGVEWRLDMVAASSKGHDLRAPIAFVSLDLIEDGAPRRLTFQATPDALRKLAKVCGDLLG
jgi:hypothetical protein